MNYEQKYKEALERAKKLQETCDNTAVVGWCEYILPELKESEDERIRKELIEHIKANKSADYVLFKRFSPDDVIAWLEKQGKKLDANEVIEWLVANIRDYEYFVKWFKKDFGL